MPDPIKRAILERFDVPESKYETVIMHVEIAPHVNTGLHTHPGFDAAYLLEGCLVVMERNPGIVHEVKTADQTAKVLAIYIVEKGKPLATPWVA